MMEEIKKIMTKHQSVMLEELDEILDIDSIEIVIEINSDDFSLKIRG